MYQDCSLCGLLTRRVCEGCRRAFCAECMAPTVSVEVVGGVTVEGVAGWRCRPCHKRYVRWLVGVLARSFGAGRSAPSRALPACQRRTVGVEFEVRGQGLSTHSS